METKIIRLVTEDEKLIPRHETDLSAGLDLKANIPEPWNIAPGERRLIPTGIKIELPEGYEAQIRPRSGLAFKHGITVLNSPGTIDADYRGEIKVLLINLGYSMYQINPMDRIAQMVITNHCHVEFDAVVELSKTDRADGGFGHTDDK